jgi:hypothetical protein
MDYGMIGKIEKAKLYASQPDRITFNTLVAEFRGDNNNYTITLSPGGWSCSCPGFRSHSICPHIMAMEKLYKAELKRAPLPYAPGQNVVSDVDKAMRYSEEPDRLRFLEFEVTFRGDNDTHITAYRDGRFACGCEFFHSRGVCGHTMALERVFHGQIEPAQPSPAAI